MTVREVVTYIFKTWLEPAMKLRQTDSAWLQSTLNGNIFYFLSSGSCIHVYCRSKFCYIFYSMYKMLSIVISKGRNIYGNLTLKKQKLFLQNNPWQIEEKWKCLVDRNSTMLFFIFCLLWDIELYTQTTVVTWWRLSKYSLTVRNFTNQNVKIQNCLRKNSTICFKLVSDFDLSDI